MRRTTNIYQDMNLSALICELKKHPRIRHYEKYSLHSHWESDMWMLEDSIYGDYVGGYVQQANSNCLKEVHPWLEERYEGYGSSMLYFDDETMAPDEDGYGPSADNIRELLETLDALTDYPVIDESEWSRLEFEAGQEAHEDWGRKEFKSDMMELCADCYEEQIDNMSDEELDEWFQDAAESGNCGETYRQDGEGLTIYCDIKRIAKEALDKRGMTGIIVK